MYVVPPRSLIADMPASSWRAMARARFCEPDHTHEPSAKSLSFTMRTTSASESAGTLMTHMMGPKISCLRISACSGTSTSSVGG